MSWLGLGATPEGILHASLKVQCLIDVIDKLQCKALFPDIFDWRPMWGTNSFKGRIRISVLRNLIILVPLLGRGVTVHKRFSIGRLVSMACVQSKFSIVLTIACAEFI